MPARIRWILGEVSRGLPKADREDPCGSFEADPATQPEASKRLDTCAQLLTHPLESDVSDAQQRTIQPAELLGQLGWVRRLARKLAGDANVAADVTQDVWLKTQGRGMESKRGLRRWLRALTRGLVRDSRREAGRRETRERAAARPELEPSASDVVERNVLQQKVSDAVMALDEPYRSTTLYRYMDGLSTGEIAVRMSVSEDAVRQRLARARKTLKARLDREFGSASSNWAIAVLGAIPAEPLVSAASTGAGAATITATSVGSSTLLGFKVAAIGATVLGSVAAWRALDSPEVSTSLARSGAAAVVAYERDEGELTPDDTPLGGRRPVFPKEEYARKKRPPDKPVNDYLRAPVQVW